MSLTLVECNSKFRPVEVSTFAPDQIEVVLGRHPENHVCIKSVSISRKHAVIKKTSDGTFQLHELKPANGVHLNGGLLKQGSVTTLADGDVIQLGHRPTALVDTEYFVYKFNTAIQTGTKRKNSTSDSPENPGKAARTETHAVAQASAEGALPPASCTTSDNQASLAKEIEIEKEKEAHAKQLEELKKLQDEQAAAMASREAELRHQLVELQNKHEEDVRNALREKELEMERRVEQINKQLEEKEKLISDAEKRRLEEQEKVALASASAAVAAQERLNDLLEDQLQCSICSELMIKPKSFACSHSFCGYCIDKWLEKKKECPICRSRVYQANPNYLLSNLIDKAVEELGDEMKSNRQSLILAREVETSKKGVSKKGKGKRNGNEPVSTRHLTPPASTVTSTIASAGGPSRAPSSTSSSTASSSSTSSSTTTATSSDITSTTSSSEASTNVPEVDNEVEVIHDDGADTVSTMFDEPIELSSSDSEFDQSDDMDDDLYMAGAYDDYIEYTGRPGGTYYGFGSCYNCGDPGHWRPDCPYM